MKKSLLQNHALQLDKAYKENNKAWAAIGILFAALQSENPPPLWMQLETLRDLADKVSENGLLLANFLDDIEQAKGVQS
jgi:hypothetical protein